MEPRICYVQSYGVTKIKRSNGITCVYINACNEFNRLIIIILVNLQVTNCTDLKLQKSYIHNN